MKLFFVLKVNLQGNNDDSLVIAEDRAGAIKAWQTEILSDQIPDAVFLVPADLDPELAKSGPRALAWFLDVKALDKPEGEADPEDSTVYPPDEL